MDSRERTKWEPEHRGGKREAKKPLVRREDEREGSWDNRLQAEMYTGRQNVQAGWGGAHGAALAEVFETVMLFLMS